MKPFSSRFCYLYRLDRSVSAISISLHIHKHYHIPEFNPAMDSATRNNMLRRVNATLGFSDEVESVQTAAERIREAFVNRPRRTIGQGPSMTELIAMSLARNACQAVESITFWWHLLIVRVITDNSWYYFSCPVCQCKKGVRKIGSVFICTSCEDVCAAPIPKYKLQLVVTNEISFVVVTLFDEIAERLITKPANDLLLGLVVSQEPSLLPLDISSLEGTYHIMELKSHTYYDHGNYESFACSTIIKPVSGLNLGIVSIAAGMNLSGANNLSDVLPQLSEQLHITNIAHNSLKSNDPSLTELLFVVRRHLKLSGKMHHNGEPLTFIHFHDPSLTQLLYMGREQDRHTQESVTFACKVLIKMLRRDTPWCYLGCDICKSNEGITAVGQVYWCGVCASICEAPAIRYCLKMHASNGKSSMVLIFHNTEAECLVKQKAIQLMPNFKIKSDFYKIPKELTKLSNTFHFLELKTNTYIDHDQYESFVWSRVLTPDPMMKIIQLGIVSSCKAQLASCELEATPMSSDYKIGNPNIEKVVVLTPAKNFGGKKRNAIESSEEE